MPTYSYECRKCGEVHSVFHGMNDSPRVKCPTCGGGCKKLLGTGAGVIFKGSGFYETDYKKKSSVSSESSSSKKDASSKPAASSSSSGDAKPAAPAKKAD